MEGPKKEAVIETDEFDAIKVLERQIKTLEKNIQCQAGSNGRLADSLEFHRQLTAAIELYAKITKLLHHD